MLDPPTHPMLDAGFWIRPSTRFLDAEAQGPPTHPTQEAHRSHRKTQNAATRTKEKPQITQMAVHPYGQRRDSEWEIFLRAIPTERT